MLKTYCILPKNQKAVSSDKARTLFLLYAMLFFINSTVLSQITSLSVDLKNSFSLSQTQQAVGNFNQRAYNQYYILSLEGYGIDPKFLLLSLQTTLTDFSSTNKFQETEQSLRSRTFGYYSVSATLFPGNHFPLSFYTSHTQEQGTVDQISYAGILETQKTRDVRRTGLRWDIAKNTFYPQIAINIERNSIEEQLPNRPVDQVNDLLSCRISNTSDNGASQYSLQYTGLRTKNDFFQLNQVNHEFLFNSSQKMSDHADLSFNGTYFIRDRMTNRNADISATYRQNDKVQHQLRLMNIENRYTGNIASGSISNSIAHQMNLTFSDRTQGMFGVNYVVQKIVGETEQTQSDRGQLQAQVAFNDRVAFADLEGAAGTNANIEKYTRGERKFTQQSHLNIGGKTNSLRQIQVSIQDNVAFATEYSIGNTLQNTVRATVMTDVISYSIVGAEFSRSDSKYLDYSLLPPRSINTVGANITSRVSSTTQIELRHTQSWAYSWYLEKNTTTRGNVSEVGFFRNLTVELTGEHSVNSYTGIEMVTIESNFNYRFYAFLFNAKYFLRKMGSFQTQGFQLEIQRPFSFDFR